MECDEQGLRSIAARASTLWERLGPGLAPVISSTHERQVEARLERWRQVAAKGDQEVFARRLVRDGLDELTVRRALGEVQLADAQPLPDWVRLLQEGLHTASSMASQAFDQEKVSCGCDPERPLPFEDLLTPFVSMARQRLTIRLDARGLALAEQAWDGLERDLLQRLVDLCLQPLMSEFGLFQAQRQPSFDRLINRLQGSASTTQYQAFVRQLLQAGLVPFFQEYPVLARLVTTTVGFWIDATSELFQRLATDWDDIRRTFQGTMELSPVVAIKPGLSDRHEQGRTVCGLKFASGLRLLYKPKELALDVAYDHLLHWLNQHHPALAFKRVTVLNRGAYGWAEYVEAQSCPDDKAIRRYYRRSGMLLALLHALEGSDAHASNIIACGEYPVLVDVETLFYPQPRDDNDTSASEGAPALAFQHLQNSVQRTYFLPRWEIERDGELVFDISGLGGVGEQGARFRILQWGHVNTDAMRVEWISRPPTVYANSPFLDQNPSTLDDYTEELVAGFQDLYRLLRQHRDELLASTGPLAAFAHQPVRYLFRHTRYYSVVLNLTLQPQYLRDGADHSIEFEILGRWLLTSTMPSSWWGLPRCEQQDLAQLDIPRFLARSDSDALSLVSGPTLAQCFVAPSYDIVVRRLQQMSAENLAQQIEIIRGALAAHSLTEPHDMAPWHAVNASEARVELVTPAILVQHAVRIAQELQHRAIRAADGSVTWLGLVHYPAARRFQFQPIGPGLYDGAGGIALFLAALGRLTDQAPFCDLARAALQPLRHLLHESTPQLTELQPLDIGAASGLGSLLYLLTQTGQWLAETTPVDDARRIASLITPEKIRATTASDLMQGTAGAILGLLTLYQSTTDTTFLEQARTCGRHLLQQRVHCDNGRQVWNRPEGPVPTGFAYGLDGIVYALSRLYQVSGEMMFLTAAHDAMAGAQPSLTATSAVEGESCSGSAAEPLSWCHGVVGRGLARLGSLAVCDGQDVRDDIEAALQAVQQPGLQGGDHLCCGNLGCLDLLLTASQHLAMPAYLTAARQQASQILARFQHTGTYHLRVNLPIGVHTPGLFQGLAGIGYQLLRLAYPDRLASVLLWD